MTSDRPTPRPSAELPPSGPELRALALRDERAASVRLNALEPEAQAALALELPAEQREALLALVEAPEEVVPLLPETELLHTLRGAGLDQGAWLLACATAEQRQACIDVDCWSAEGFDPERFREWVDALIDAGGDALLSALSELDDEIWVLGLSAMAAFELGRDGGGDTEDGLVWYAADDDRDTDRVRAILRECLASGRGRYFSLVAAVINGESVESEELARLWRDGRMNDLGFPSLDQAMRAYRPLRAEDAESIQIATTRQAAFSQGEVLLPVAASASLLGDALRALPPQLATDMLGYILGVANALAVADRMDLSEPESVPAAFAKAMRGMECGLRALAKQRGQAPQLVLQHTRPLDLFRIGVTLEPELAAIPERDDPSGVDESVYEEFLSLFGDDAGVEPIWEPGDDE